MRTLLGQFPQQMMATMHTVREHLCAGSRHAMIDSCLLCTLATGMLGSDTMTPARSDGRSSVPGPVTVQNDIDVAARGDPDSSHGREDEMTTGACGCAIVLCVCAVC